MTLEQKRHVNVWIMLNNAFISCVADREDSSLVLVRARRKGDIKRAIGSVGGREVKSKGFFDYPYRAWITREQLKLALAEAVDHIDYPNFKDSVKEQTLHDAYLRVWIEMLAIEAYDRAKAAERKLAAVQAVLHKLEVDIAHGVRSPLLERASETTGTAEAVEAIRAVLEDKP